MEDHIFFKDKKNELKGPFTERQVQEWYRQKWFDSSFPFYFTHGNECPSDVENSGVSLEELRSYNGIGCPFRRIDESKKNEEMRRREEGRKRLEKIEKEIADLKPKCAAILGMEKSIEQIKKKLEGLRASLNKDLPKPVEKAPKVEPVKKKEEKYEEFANTYAQFILETLVFYETGKYNHKFWGDRPKTMRATLRKGTNKEQAARKAACERIFVEKMKEKEFFCCFHCDTVQFNYKQALIHFTSKEHDSNEAAFWLSTTGDDVSDATVSCALKVFTNVHLRLAEEDAKIEQERRKKYGPVDLPGAMRQGLRPTGHFMKTLGMKYMRPLFGNSAVSDAPLTDATAVVMHNVKGEIGRRIMAELNEHIGQEKTWCFFCGIKTGDREGFYAHLISSAHLTTLDKGGPHFKKPLRYEMLTTVVNVHRKDLV